MISDKPMKPKIIAFVDDVLFGSQIASAAEGLGFVVEFVGRGEEMGAGGETSVPPRPGEPVDGRDGSLFAWLVARQPALVIFDLDNGQIPWQRWMPSIKSSPATRQFPVLGYGMHTNKEAFEKAKGCGADGVATRGRLAAEMRDTIQKLARVPDYAALASACAEPLSALGREGIELFNKGAYYDCHHALEAAWNEDGGAGRNLYKGILQVAVAYYQIERGNYNGAIKLILRMRQWLDPLPEVCRGIGVGQLRRDALAVSEALQRLGRERIGEFDKGLLKGVGIMD